MRFVIFILAALLVFGCTGSAPEDKKDDAPMIPGVPTAPAEECTPDYSFSELEDGVFSKEEGLVATVTCAAGKTFVLSVDGKSVDSKTVSENATTPVEFQVPAIRDGTVDVKVDSEGETLFSREWEVSPLGNQETMGTGYESFSFKRWIALAHDIESEVEVGQVRIYMKRQSSHTQPSSKIVLEIREDSGGEIGSLVSTKTLPIDATTLSENWIKFDYEDKVKLTPGTYWFVLKIDQTEEISLVSDVVTVHYEIIDKQALGNDYTKAMALAVDEKTGKASETFWEPLPYDKEFNIVLSYGK